MIKCVIFDLDGVITSSSDQHFQAWCELAESLGKKLDPGVEVYTRGVSRMKSLEIVLDAIGMGDAFSDGEKEKMAVDKNVRYKELISLFTPDNLEPGIRDLLDELKAKGIKIALGSASKNGPFLLERLGIMPYFDFITNPAEVKHPKPAPDTFLAASYALGFEPCECVGIEDAVAGVKAIKAAGMFAVGIGDKGELSEADIVYSTVRDMDTKDFLTR